MPSTEKITDEIYVNCKVMLKNLLQDSRRLGVGYVLQLIYELAVVIIAYEAGSDRALDKYFKQRFSNATSIITARNVISNNSYDLREVRQAVTSTLECGVVKEIYLDLLGTAEGYSLFETECYLYLEYMRQLRKGN